LSKGWIEVSKWSVTVRGTDEGTTPTEQRGSTMWDTVQTDSQHLSHDLPCPGCGHAVHTFLACGDTCDCAKTGLPGTAAPTLSGLAA
jgi:hypothetical protein